MLTAQRVGDGGYDAGEHDEPGAARGADQHHVGRDGAVSRVGTASPPAVSRRRRRDTVLRGRRSAAVVDIIIIIIIGLIDDQGQVELRRQRRMSAVGSHHAQFYYLPTAPLHTPPPGLQARTAQMGTHGERGARAYNEGLGAEPTPITHHYIHTPSSHLSRPSIDTPMHTRSLTI